jgi:iron-sulfur cluster repair protein YtfE (RIC family)
MTKRNEALIPLTHDHHHALGHARRLIEAAGSDSAAQCREARTTFLEFYENDLLVHMHEEEEALFPTYLDVVDEPPTELVQVLIEHVAIHGLVTRLRDGADASPDRDLLKELGETLREHVRMEEKVLFPLIEASVAGAQLGSLEFAPRNRAGVPA